MLHFPQVDSRAVGASDQNIFSEPTDAKSSLCLFTLVVTSAVSRKVGIDCHSVLICCRLCAQPGVRCEHLLPTDTESSHRHPMHVFHCPTQFRMTSIDGTTGTLPTGCTQKWLGRRSWPLGTSAACSMQGIHAGLGVSHQPGRDSSASPHPPPPFLTTRPPHFLLPWSG
jgi:hypothetical protein